MSFFPFMFGLPDDGPQDPNFLVMGFVAQEALQSMAVKAYGRRMRRVAFMYYQLDMLAEKLSFEGFCRVMDEVYPWMAQGPVWGDE
ncbi:hypothetical protein [Ralstonia phage RSP15]|uniref:hypothetical protein n=1 Tax=Ralstonia phage RSP15 TaxID=1785960 RepID=UPI00074D4576|nr:hypothetical protein BH754_gp206 [Ralstonia phage RSP15]BAU40100.1 hypothetical protein [Ralstonia phage RSP15]